MKEKLPEQERPSDRWEKIKAEGRRLIIYGMIAAPLVHYHLGRDIERENELLSRADQRHTEGWNKGRNVARELETKAAAYDADQKEKAKWEEIEDRYSALEKVQFLHPHLVQASDGIYAEMLILARGTPQVLRVKTDLTSMEMATITPPDNYSALDESRLGKDPSIEDYTFGFSVAQMDSSGNTVHSQSFNIAPRGLGGGEFTFGVKP